MIRDPMQALERDLQAERASALARITDLFEKAFAVWEALEAGQLVPLGTAEAELERRVELRELTAERLWMLMVQRETVGLRESPRAAPARAAGDPPADRPPAACAPPDGVNASKPRARSPSQRRGVVVVS